MGKTMLAGLALTAVAMGCNTAMAQSGGDLSYSYIEGGVSVLVEGRVFGGYQSGGASRTGLWTPPAVF